MREQWGSAGSFPPLSDLWSRELQVSLPLATRELVRALQPLLPFSVLDGGAAAVGNKPGSGLITSDLFPEGGKLLLVLQSLPRRG